MNREINFPIDDQLRFTVLMSVYFKEKAEHLEESLKNVLVNQSILPEEMVLVKDGPLTEDLEFVVDKYESMFPSTLKVVALPKNVGLGKALDFGLEECS